MKSIIYRTVLPLFAAFALAGCKEAELMDYEISQEAINFYSTDERLSGVTQNNYPDVLTREYAINTYANNNGNVAEVTVDFSVQTMGGIGGTDRKVVLRAKETTGYQAALPYTEITIPAGENLVQLTTIPINHVPKGYMTKWVVEFDYENSDFIPGLEERQLRTITIDNRFTYASVNISEASWIYMAGSKAAGTIGIGPYSSLKIKFMTEVWGTYNFSTPATYANYYNMIPAYIIYWQPYVDELRAALAEYKANSATDPVNYPPILDDVKNDGSWIAFEEE